MKIVRTQITENETPGLADIAMCECGCDLFRLAENIERMHVHFICGQCGQAYCPDKDCSAKPNDIAGFNPL